MELVQRLFPIDTTPDKLKAVIKVAGVCLAGKFALYLRWRNSINRRIPGPPDSLLMGASMELYRAGLNDFWGFNPRLFQSLFSRYGKIVRFWLPGSGLFVCCSDVDDVAELNKKCVGRPDLTETLLPYLGSDNLLFQKGPMIKSLRLRYGSMVGGKDVVENTHDITYRLLEERWRGWHAGKPVDLHGELDTLIYDIMGQAIFGGNWTERSEGKAIRTEHLYLIKWSSRYGMEVLKDPSWANFFNAGSDLRKYFASIKRFRGICGDLVSERRKAVAANPAQHEGDRTALTMLVTEKKSSTDGSPFFSEHLAVSTCIGFLNGAYDTTHSTSFWIFYHLAKHGQEQKRLAAEVDKLFQGGKPSLSDLRGCALLDAFLKESMRLRPTVPIGMRVPETEDVTIGGVLIPRGTTVLPYLDYRPGTEAYFGADTDEFRPDRFLGDDDAAVRARQKIDRFGGFARMCVGMNFALAELKAMTAWVLHEYSIELADPNIDAEMIYEAGVYQPREHFHFVFKKRSGMSQSLRMMPGSIRMDD